MVCARVVGRYHPKRSIHPSLHTSTQTKYTHRAFRLLKSVAIPQLTCFQCHPHPQPHFLVAAGTHHGRVHLVNFKASGGSLGQILIPSMIINMFMCVLICEFQGGGSLGQFVWGGCGWVDGRDVCGHQLTRWGLSSLVRSHLIQSDPINRNNPPPLSQIR